VYVDWTPNDTMINLKLILGVLECFWWCC